MACHKPRQNFSTEKFSTDKFLRHFTRLFLTETAEIRGPKRAQTANAGPTWMTGRLTMFAFYTLQARMSPVQAPLCRFMNTLLPALARSCCQVAHSHGARYQHSEEWMEGGRTSSPAAAADKTLYTTREAVAVQRTPADRA